MIFDSSLTTVEVLAVFSEEIVARDGRISDTFHDGNWLFVRSVLPRVEQVRPGDRFQRGVALRATGENVCLYPYLFREICQNGAIVAETSASRLISSIHYLEPQSAIEAIREGVAACCEPKMFIRNMHRMRRSCEIPATLALSCLAVLSRFPPGSRTRLLRQFMERMSEDGDMSQYGFANAVTSVARDTPDPESRWNLEELGGGIAVRCIPKLPMDSGHATAEVPDAFAEV